MLKIEFTEEQFTRVFMKLCECLDEFDLSDRGELYNILKDFVIKNNKLIKWSCGMCYNYGGGTCERYEGEEDDYENDYDPNKEIHEEEVEPNHVCRWFVNPYINGGETDE